MNRTLLRLLTGLTALGAVVGLAAPAVAEGSYVSQIGTYDYLTNPANYTGLAAIKDALGDSTLGLGTFDHLDGELILVGGKHYRVGLDGVPQEFSTDRTSPFFQSIAFHADASGPVPPGTTCSTLTTWINQLANTDAGVVAVRVRGTFSDLTFRSVAAQPEPYPPLSQVVAGQTLFPLGQRRAVLVGFRTGQDFAGTGAPGLHLHGVSADRRAGGHVISCVAGPDVQLSIQRAAGVTIID